MTTATNPTAPARILHVAQPTIGDVPQSVLDLAAGQQTKGDQVIVACPNGGVLAERAKELGAQVRQWDSESSPTKGVRTEFRALKRIIDEVQPDLVHLHGSKAGLIGRLVVRGRIPTVFQPHAWSFGAVEGTVRTASAVWESQAARWAHRIVCPTETDRREGLSAGVRGPRARYSIVPNGMDTAAFADVEPAPAHPQYPTVVCFARLCRRKGQDILLTAWQAVLSQVPEAHLILVGDGPDRAALEAQARRAGITVEFAGDVPTGKPWYARADVVALPSRWESMALVPLEAMAAGRPVVATDVAGVRETLPPTQTPIPVEDPQALAEALSRMLLDDKLRARTAAEGRKHVIENFDMSAVVERMYEVYEAAFREARSSSVP